MACHKDRSKDSYKIDFSTSKFLDYLPQLRFRCSLSGNLLSRHNWSTELSSFEVKIVERINGQRSIGEIITELSLNNLLANHKLEELKQLVKMSLQRLWQLDFLVMGLPSLMID